jgi:hypothetical protein
MCLWRGGGGGGEAGVRAAMALEEQSVGVQNKMSNMKVKPISGSHKSKERPPGAGLQLHQSRVHLF